MSCVIQQGGVTIIETGPSYSSLDYGALEGLGEVLLSEAAYADPPRLILDMSQTTFVSSSFIELLVRAWKRIKQRQGVMVLCAIQPYCREVLQTSRLDTIWPTFATRAEAERAAANPTEGS